MGLNVAQLTIGVNADTSQAQTALNSLNSGITQLGSTAMASASGGLNAAFQQVQVAMSVMPSEIEAINARMAQFWPEATAGAQQFAGAMKEANNSVAGMAGVGGTAATALGNINMAMVASGQQLGPLNSGLMLFATTLRQLPSDASAASTAILAVGGAVTALGIASAAAAAPLHQATEGLASAMQNNGDAISEWSKELDNARSHAENLGITNANMEKGLTVLVRGFGDTDLALKELNDTESLAAARHQSVEAAASTVVRAYEGYGRSLKELGINMTFVRNTQQALDAANRALADSTQKLADETAKYNEALDKDNATHQEAALARDQVAQASQRLSDANANLLFTEQRIAAEEAVRAAALSATQQAVESLATAEQNLAYVQDKLAAQAEVPVTDHASVALKKIQDAEIALENANARLAASTTITTVEQDQLASSTDRVMEAQQRMAAATGGGILAAQVALRSAISQQREELDRLHAKMVPSIIDLNAQKKAAEDLAAAQAGLAPAQAQDKGDADLKAIERAHELKVAEDAVNKARAAVPLAIQKDYAEQQLRAIENANQMRTAQNQVRDAQEAVTQAYRNQAAEALKLHVADLAVADAKRALDDATRKEQEAQAKVVEATARHNQELQQQQKVLEAIHEKIKGFAESQAQGWVGSLNRIKAAITDWLGHFGEGAGKFLVFALPVMLMLKGMGGALFGGGAAEGAAGAAAGAAEGGGLLAGLGALAAAAAPVVAVVAAVVAVGAAFYLAYTHIKSFHDGVDAVGRYIMSILHPVLKSLEGPLHDMSKLWGQITKDIDHLAHDVLGFFQAELKKVNQFIAEHRVEITNAIHVLHEIADVIKTGVVFVLEHLLVPALHQLTTVFKVTWDIIYGAVKFVWDGIKTTIKVALDIILGVIGVVLDLISGHWGKAWNDLKNMVAGVFNDIVDGIKSTLGDLVGTVVKLAGDIIHGIWNGLKDTVKAIFDFGKLMYDHIIKPVLDFFGIGSPSKKMHGLGEDIIHGLWNGIVEWGSQFMNFESKVHDWIIKPIENIGGDMFTMGKNLLIGLWNGIADWSQTFVDKIGSFFGSVVDDIGSFLGIGSPSTITHQHGEWLMEGLANGIQAGLPRVLAAINANSGLINNAVSSLGAAGVNATNFGGLGLTSAQQQRVAGGIGTGGTPILVQNFNKELLRVDGNLIHERDLAPYIKDLIIAAGRRQGGNYFGGYA